MGGDGERGVSVSGRSAPLARPWPCLAFPYQVAGSRPFPRARLSASRSPGPGLRPVSSWSATAGTVAPTRSGGNRRR